MALLDFLMRKQRRIQLLLDQYLERWSACLEASRQAWATYFAEGPGERFAFKVEQTHKEESQADDLRRQIELELYGKALLPDSRGDIFSVLESVDQLLSDLEWALYQVTLETLQLPKGLQGTFEQLVSVVCRCSASLELAVRALLVEAASPAEVRKHVDKVDYLESESDHLERALIRMIFALEMGAGRKLLLKEVVTRLGSVCDGAERAANRVGVVSVKRTT
jgi:predicted phosphate transport protein (TIGR00153 family)